MRNEIKHELDRLRAESVSGMLTTAAVIEAARDPASPLHECFTWDETRGFELNLISEAQDLIQSYTVVVQLPAGPSRVRQYVSLSTDRARGGGYRLTSEVLSDEHMSEILLADALRDFESMQIRYGKVEELKRVFAEIDSVRNRKRKRKRPPRDDSARPSA